MPPKRATTGTAGTTASTAASTATATAAHPTWNCGLGIKYLLNQGLKDFPLVVVGDLQTFLGAIQTHLGKLRGVKIPTTAPSAATTATLGHCISRPD